MTFEAQFQKTFFRKLSYHCTLSVRSQLAEFISWCLPIGRFSWSDDKDVSGACIIFNQESFSINPSFYNWPSGYSGWEKCEFNLMNINCFRNLKKFVNRIRSMKTPCIDNLIVNGLHFLWKVLLYTWYVNDSIHLTSQFVKLSPKKHILLA